MQGLADRVCMEDHMSNVKLPANQQLGGSAVSAAAHWQLNLITLKLHQGLHPPLKLYAVARCGCITCTECGCACSEPHCATLSSPCCASDEHYEGDADGLGQRYGWILGLHNMLFTHQGTCSLF